jgi:hypothetical protein
MKKLKVTIADVVNRTPAFERWKEGDYDRYELERDHIIAELERIKHRFISDTNWLIDHDISQPVQYHRGQPYRRLPSGNLPYSDIHGRTISWD